MADGTDAVDVADVAAVTTDDAAADAQVAPEPKPELEPRQQLLQVHHRSVDQFVTGARPGP